MKILELCEFSEGVCGVWQRVKQESLELSRKGYEVYVFSSNAIKGSSNLAQREDRIGKVRIMRFPFKKLGGESFMAWNFEEQALKFKPDIIIAHVYRHLHTKKALEIAKKIKAKVFLVTHAPFIEKNFTRSFIAKLIVNFYDKFIGPKIINKFDKVIIITKWEIPYLLRLGAKKDKLVYIPNGLPEEFFQRAKRGQGILFLGRISPIKNLGAPIISLKKIIQKYPDLKFKIVGPAENHYKTKLENLVRIINLEKNILFLPPVYELKKKIKIIDDSAIFILPSKREAMPQALIEAMARGKIVLSSKTQGGKELVQDGKNGFLFDYMNYKQLQEQILFSLDKRNKNKIEKMKERARTSAEKFRYKSLIGKLESLFK